MKDLTNGLDVFVKIGPKSSKSLGIPHTRATVVWGGVRRPGAGKDEFIRKITGDYADTVFLDGHPVWKLETDFAQRPSPRIAEDLLLPSDARFRIDRAMLIDGIIPAAEEAKCLLEQLQRRDDKLRSTPVEIRSTGRRRSSTL
jgi:hypothetical protein